MSRINVATTERLKALSSIRDRVRQELIALDGLILSLQVESAATEKKMARFELGEQLGATKLARLLGCSRNHAIKHLETTFVNEVRTKSNGYRWVPRSAVEAWLESHEKRAG